MTLDSADTDVATRASGVPVETFDVEPPYVVDDEALMHEALALATRLAAMPTKALGLIRRLAR